MTRSLENMVVIITGASSGIGRALAEYLSARKARLTLAARRLDRLESLNNQLGGQHQVVQCDVANQDDCRNLIASAAAHHGRIDTPGLQCRLRAWPNPSPTPAPSTFAEFLKPICSAPPTPFEPRFPSCFVNPKKWLARADHDRLLGSSPPGFTIFWCIQCHQGRSVEHCRIDASGIETIKNCGHQRASGGNRNRIFRISRKNGQLHRASPRQGRSAADCRHRCPQMAAAIVRPRPEVWPLGMARLGISISTLVPGMVDFALRGYRKSIGDPKPQASTAV